jgi:hypothetical protein
LSATKKTGLFWDKQTSKQLIVLQFPRIQKELANPLKNSGFQNRKMKIFKQEKFRKKNLFFCYLKDKIINFWEDMRTRPGNSMKIAWWICIIC